VSERAGVSERREVGDDRRGRPVSERERESGRARGGPPAGPPAGPARAGASAWARGPVGLGRIGEEENQPEFVLFLFFFFQINE
jgi:hypothetical protein